MTSRPLAAACAALPLALVAASSRPPRDLALPPAAGARFAISFPAARSAAPLDGRVLLMLSTDTTAEPRFQISDGPTTQLIFGIDVDGLRPGQEAVIDAGAFDHGVLPGPEPVHVDSEDERSEEHTAELQSLA